MKIIITESQLKMIVEKTEDEEVSTTSVTYAKKLRDDLGLTNAAAAAIAANIEHESSFKPDKIQNGYGPDTGNMSQSGGGGYSWAQWTFGKRKKAFRNYVKDKFKVDINTTPATSAHAYSFLKYELQNPENTLYDYGKKDKESLKYHNLDLTTFSKIKDVNSATNEFVTKYEMAGKPMTEKRKKIAKAILNKMNGNSTPTPSPTPSSSSVTYTVKSGDTLTKIAAKYGSDVTVESIKKLNKLKSVDDIKAGQVLKIK
jgi:LysM repeat protein